MIQNFHDLKINTNGQKLYEFTRETCLWIPQKNFKDGILNLSIMHTSASLIVQENADPDVQKDLLNYFDKIAPMDNNLYIHNTEGKDDMPAHIKTMLTAIQISIPFAAGKLLLGTWQGIYLWEHRRTEAIRKIIMHLSFD